MPAPVLKVAGRDLSTYLNVHAEDGFDPVNADRSQPQFSEAAAFHDGGVYVGDAIKNREFVIPLVLTAADRATLYQLIRDINKDLTQGAQVEYSHDGTVDPSTFFDLERGRLDIKYEYFVATHATLRAVLHLWTRPQGYTGTARTIASLTGSVTHLYSVVDFPATGLVGDLNSLAKLEVRVGSVAASSGRVIGYGVHQSASFLGFHPAASFADKAASSLATGASGMVGSMYLAIPGGATGASGILFRDYLTPPGGYVGRHRVFALLRSNLAGVNHALYAQDRDGNRLGPTVVASQSDPAKVMLADLGEINVPAMPSGRQDIPSQFVELHGGGASGGTYGQASGYGLTINGLIYLPLGISPGLMRTAGVAGGGGLLYREDFLHTSGYLEAAPAAVPGPGIWSKISGYMYRQPGGAAWFISPAGASPSIPPGATGFYALGSGGQQTDVSMQAQVALNSGGSSGASGAEWQLWPKGVYASGAASQGVWARFIAGPSANISLALFSLVPSTNGNLATVLHASAGLGGSTASGLWAGNKLFTLWVETVQGEGRVYLATGAKPASPILNPSSALLSAPGGPAVFMQAGNANNAWPYMEAIKEYAIGAASAIDILPREYFRMESHPDTRIYQGNGSIYTTDRIANFRGQPPEIPPVGSPGASGPARVVVFAGSVDDMYGNDLLDIRLDVVDQFVFMR